MDQYSHFQWLVQEIQVMSCQGMGEIKRQTGRNEKDGERKIKGKWKEKKKIGESKRSGKKREQTRERKGDKEEQEREKSKVRDRRMLGEVTTMLFLSSLLVYVSVGGLSETAQLFASVMLYVCCASLCE